MHSGQKLCAAAPHPPFLTGARSNPAMCTMAATPAAVALPIGQIDISRSHWLPLLSIKSCNTGVGQGPAVCVNGRSSGTRVWASTGAPMESGFLWGYPMKRRGLERQWDWPEEDQGCSVQLGSITGLLLFKKKKNRLYNHLKILAMHVKY